MDGAGSGAAVVDAMAGLIPVLPIRWLRLLTAGNTRRHSPIHRKIQFRDTGIYINSSADGQLDIVADTEIQIAATTVDLNGNLDVSGTALVTGVLTTTAATVFNGGFASNADSTLGTDKKVQFRDSAIYINSSADGQLDIVADTEIQIAATTIDINGAINASGEIIAASLDISGDIDVDGTTNLDVVDIDGAVDMASTLAVGSTIAIGQTSFSGGSILLDLHGSGSGTGSQASFYNDHNTSGFQIGLAGNTSGDVIFYNVANTDMDFYTNNALRFSITNSEIVVNDQSADVDFRVESDTLTHALFVDGASGYVGINDSSPGAQLDLNTSSGLMTILNSTHTNGGYVRFEKSEVVYGDLGNGAQIVSGGATTAFGMNTRGTGDLLLATNGVTRASLQDGGAFTTTPAAGGHAVFNEDGVDADFRVESDSNANMLHVDGFNNGVGIGTTGTTTPLTINGGTASTATIQLGNHGDNASIHAKYNLAFKADSTEAIAGRTIGFEIGTHSAFYSTVGGTVFNEGDADADFRVESADNQYALFVDGGNNDIISGALNGNRNTALSDKRAGTTGLQLNRPGEDDEGGHLFMTETAVTDTWMDIVQCHDDGATGVLFLIHGVRAADQNRSYAALVRYAYQDAFNIMSVSSQNATVEYRVSGNALQYRFTTAGPYIVNLTVMAAG